MKLPNPKKIKHFHLFLVVTIFFISRAVYDWLGIIFQGETYLSAWQTIDPLLLRIDLWRSIYYLHSQPPTMNLFIGIILQLFPSINQSVFHLFFYLAGLILAISIYFLGTFFGFSKRSSMVLSMIFIISPSTVLYEHFLSYCYLIAAALTLAGVALHQFVQTQRIDWGMLFFSLLAFISMSWSLFHIVWMVSILLILLTTIKNRKNVFLAAILPLLLVIGWYVKNQIVFGEFTASSWGGMNLSNSTTFRLSEKERVHMVKTGELSKFAKYFPFRNPEVYLKLLPDTPTTGIPILDLVETSNGQLNHHHLSYIEASKYYLHDALHVIRIRPLIYLRSIEQSLYIFFHSASDYDFIGINRVRIKTFDLWWNRIFFGQWQNNENSGERMISMSILNVSWWILIAFLTAFFGSLGYLWKNRKLIGSPKYLLVIFMSINILFVALTGNLMDIGENNRFRYVIDPYIFLLFIFFAVNVIRPQNLQQ